MHELSLAANIFETLARTIERPSDVGVVNVTVGTLSGVNADALSFGFSSLAERFGYSDVKLQVHNAPARVRCDSCGEEYRCEHFDDLCPKCCSIQRSILSGTELTIDSVELKE